MTHMNTLASQIIAVANKNNIPVTNLQIQKTMFFTIRNYIIKRHRIDSFIKKIYDEPFYTWPYGPVVPSIYFRFCGYGSMPIVENDKLDNNYKTFNKSILIYIKQNVFDLVNKTHQQPIWKNNENGIIHEHIQKKYKFKDIEADIG